MNPRRSKSVKLVSSARATKPLEVDVADDDHHHHPRMSSSADNTVYCCIARGRKVIYRYSSKNSSNGDNNNDTDPETESTAALCLEHAPPHHRHYVHTAGSRSYAFLTADDGHTFFAIIDPCVGNAGALHFLERVRDVFFRNSAQQQQHRSNGFHDSLVPAVQRLVASLEKMPRAAFVLEENNVADSSRGGGSNETSSSTCTSSKVPLLGKSGSRKEKKKKSKDKAAVSSQGGGENETRGVRIDMPAEEDVGGMSLERSASQSRLRRQQPSRSLWMRHVKIIIVVDAVICLALFAAWLAVCKGFQCVSS